MNQTTVAMFSAEALKRRLSGIFLSRIMARAAVEIDAAQLVKLSQENFDRIGDILPQTAQLNMSAEHPVMFCVFSGDNAIEKVAKVVKNINESFGSTLIVAADSVNSASSLMPVISAITACSNLLTDVPAGGNERTLLIIKPENFRAPSTKPGAIIDMLMSLDLDWVGCKVHAMTTNDALEFYGPVQQALRNKLEQKIGLKALEMLEKEFDFKFSPEAAAALVKTAGNAFADDQFEQIVEFMSGKRPSQVPLEERDNPGSAKCMVLIFDGADAVAKIRAILGPTNPAQASGGTVRYDFGTNIMINAAHASDSVASYERESKIVRVNENNLSQITAAAAKVQ